MPFVLSVIKLTRFIVLLTNPIEQAGEAGRDIAAVDRDLGAADKTRLVGSEEQHQLGAFLGRALAVQRYRGARGRRKALAAALEKPGIGDLPRMDRVDPDVPRRELQYRRLG